MKTSELAAVDSTILIVDDDPGTVKILVQILKPLGKIYFTTQPKDAYALAQSVQPDIILLDIEMPEKDGFAVCHELIADPVLVEVPILFVTAHTDVETEAHALKTCALDFIHKPPHPEIVKARVSNYLALKHQRARLQQLSFIDGLTGVANRRAFDKAILQEWRRACRSGTPLSLLMVDVDHFKRFNDSHGHQAGDTCLMAIARTLSQVVKRPGDMAARFGGEEFAVLLPNCTFEMGLHIAEQVRKQVAALNVTDENSTLPGPVTISIGVAGGETLCALAKNCWRMQGAEMAFPGCGIDPDQLILSADEALYQAKRSGRNQVQPHRMDNSLGADKNIYS